MKSDFEFMTTSEAILFVSSFFMWLYIGRHFVMITTFDDLFLTQSWWLLLPLVTFILFLRSFVVRRLILHHRQTDEDDMSRNASSMQKRTYHETGKSSFFTLDRSAETVSRVLSTPARVLLAPQSSARALVHLPRTYPRYRGAR